MGGACRPHVLQASPDLTFFRCSQCGNQWSRDEMPTRELLNFILDVWAHQMRMHEEDVMSELSPGRAGGLSA